jgi:rod shape-determining protein MreC
MAPPSPRRPGFSKRAQLGLFLGYVVAVTGGLLGLLLVITSQVDPAGNVGIQTFLSDVFSPVSRTGRAIVTATRDGGASVSAYFDAASKNKEMSEELKAVRPKLIESKALELENRRLKKLVGLVEQRVGPSIVAQLISSTGSSSRRFAVLSAGSDDGVTASQIVTSPEGLVGQISATGRRSSRVRLITDSDSTIPVRRVSDGLIALAIGIGDGRLELNAQTSGTNPFRARDIFVTSGAGGVYRPGIPVAIGISQGRDGTLARPLADPSQLDFAVVEPEFVEQPPLPQSEIPRAPE